MNQWICFVLCMGWLSISVPVGAQEAEATAEEEASSEVTIITSDRLTFDYQEKYAFFEGNVKVVDPSMIITSDELRVTFNEDGEADLIVARGQVHIVQEDKESDSGVATYDVGTGKVVLEEEPRVKRGRDLLQGERITFYRNEDKMICEPRARLVIYPEKGGTRDLLGE